ncbi:MAG: thioredoxin family protein [Bdellovibrionota bacterium]
MALTYTPQASSKMQMIPFAGPLVDGRHFDSQALNSRDIKVIAFICGHCPYVLAIEDRLIEFGKKLKTINGELLAICSNDPSENLEDTPAALKQRAHEKSYSFDYLIDETQEIAKKYGAVCTPDFFVFDKTGQLFYRGRLDDSWRDSKKVKNEEMWQAIQARLKNQSVPEQIPSMGCSIKWKNQ